MAKVDEVRRRFWGKVVTCFASHYPCRIKNVGLDGENVRKLVWSFKRGENTEYVAQKTADELKRRTKSGIRISVREYVNSVGL